MPREIVKTRLPDVGAPFEWAVRSDRSLYTAQVPIRSDGTFELGTFDAQCQLTFANLFATLEDAGIGERDVTQVLIFLTDAADSAAMNSIYREHFAPPYPNRASVVVSSLAIAGMKIEVIAHADMPGQTSPSVEAI